MYPKIFSYLNQGINWLLPFVCVLCRGRTYRNLALCHPCEKDFPLIAHACHQCAIPLASYTATEVCGQCLKKPPPFDSTIALYLYQTPVAQLISKLKFQHKLIYAKLLGELLAQKLQEQLPLAKPDCIIPVPLYHKRLQERGFNQALELARPIAKKLQIPIAHNSCIRIKATEPQTLIAANLRQNNIKQAFLVQKPFLAKHVAIIDDVVTTGCTVAELSEMLRAAGVKKIEIWCCARTPSP